VLPIVLAILLALVFAPVIRVLGRRGVPAAVAAVLIFVGLGLAAIGVTLVLSGPVTSLVEDAPQIAAKIRERTRPYLNSLALVSRVSQEVDRMTDGVEASPGQQEVVIAQPGLVSWVRGGLTGLGSTILATLLLTPFLLASRHALRLKLVRIRRRLSSQKHALQVFNDVENEVSRYLFTIATINAGLGWRDAVELHPICRGDHRHHTRRCGRAGHIR
jgi:predicted PurR-regulated permease PerM